MPDAIPRVDPQAISSSPFKRALFAFALTKAGTWYSSQLGARVDPWLLRATRGHVDHAFGQIPIVLVNVRGARSGIERTVPLLYFNDGDDVILIASSFGRPKFPAWYYNLKANPDVRLEVRGRSGAVRRARGHGRGPRPPVRAREAGLPRLRRLRASHGRHPQDPGDAALAGGRRLARPTRGRGSRRRLPAGATPRRAR